VDTDRLDRDAYRRWWEAEGRDDVSVCPCGNPAGEDIVMPIGEVWTDELRISARPGFCARHSRFGPNVTRDVFAGYIMDGTFQEADLTEEEARNATFYGAGIIRGKPN
jgi:hypothetical protein